MNYLIFLMLGFGALWAGLKLFDDEIFLITMLLVGSGLALIGLLSAPVPLQIGIEAFLVINLFHICMECVKRGDRG